MPNQVRVGVGVTGAKGAASDLDKLRDKFANLQKQSAKGLAIGAGAAATTKALNMVGEALGGVTDLVNEATQAYLADQESQNRMQASLKANVAGWNGNTDAIEAYITAQQRLGFDDETLRDSLTVLVGATHDVAKAEKVASVAMDLARFKGIDLRTASEALIKVEGGHYRALAQLGIKLKEGATSEEALAAVQKIANGQADAYANTLSGKLAAAAVKSKEALEHLGQATAEFSADFETARAGAIENFVTGLDFLVDGLHASEQPMQRQAELARVMIGLNPLLSASQKAAANAALDFAVANYKAADTTGELRRALIDVKTPTSDAADGLAGTADAVDGLTDAEKANIAETKRAAGVVDYLGQVADKAAGELTKLDDALFGATERAGDLAQAHQDLADLMDKQPAKKHTREWTIWNGKVAEAKQRIFDLQYQEKQTEGPKALDEWLRKQRDALSKANKKGRDYLNTLIALNSLNLGPAARAALTRISGVTGSQQPGGFGGKQFAAGGHYQAGVPRMVGEKGIEVDVPDHSGTIIPNNALGGGSSTTININVSTPALTPGGAESLARYLEPIITRAQQKRGLLAGSRAF